MVSRAVTIYHPGEYHLRLHLKLNESEFASNKLMRCILKHIYTVVNSTAVLSFWDKGQGHLRCCLNIKYNSG